MGILKTAFLVVKNSPEYMHQNLLPCWLIYGAFSAILMVISATWASFSFAIVFSTLYNYVIVIVVY